MYLSLKATKSLLVIAFLALAGLVTTVTSYRAQAATSTPSYYISVGDSLAEGYQANMPSGDETLHGYANRVITDVASSQTLTLENFGCGGDTTIQMLYSPGCSAGNLANDGVAYPTTSQLAAAVSFIEAHPDQIGLITITIGGNDFGNVPLSTIQANIENIASQLRSAAGTSVPMLGLGYYDTGLDAWFSGATGRTLASQSVSQTANMYDSTLEAAYASANVTFVNIASDFGTFQPFARTVKLAPYGKVPLAVARICQLTWMCRPIHDEHPNAAGYALMAREVAQAYLALVG